MVRWTPQMVTPKINSFLASRQLSYRPASRSWYFEKQPLSERELARRLAYIIGAPVCHTELALAVRGQELARDSRTELEKWVRDLEAQKDDDYFTGHFSAERGAEALDCFLRNMVRDCDLDDTVLMQCHRWAMKQWIWQVKRSVLGMPVTWHVTPIFWSKENGTGKTFNVKRMLSYVAGFTRHMTVDELGEKFSKKLLSQTFVVMFDEFAKAGDADIATFKAMITGRPLEGREMYGEGGFYAENRLSCIATSNLAPPHNFEDTSGARRFWPIHCRGSAAGDEFAAERIKRLDNLNFELIWNCISVDVSSVQQLIPAHVKERMESERSCKMRAKDSFEVFIEECVVKGEAEDRVPFKALIEAYRQWCGQTNHKRLKAGQRLTAERLEDLGYICVNSSNKRFLCGCRLNIET